MVSLGLFSLGKHSAETLPEVLRISVEPDYVRVNISNPERFAAELVRVEGNRQTIVLNLPQRPQQSLEIPLGAYQINYGSKNQFQLAIPAMLRDNELTIELHATPKNRDDWCWIPKGETIIGDTLGVGSEDERPVRTMNLQGFWLGKTEVTNSHYADFLSSQVEVNPKWIDLESRKCRIQSNGPKFETDAPDLPVVMVSLHGAQAYCDWLSEKTQQTCRLPTEWEWEKAARGPGSFVFSYGNIYEQSRANQESGTLKQVGEYQPNAFGLHDMTGNVFEWMSNRYDPTQETRTMNHSLRGGSFVLDGMYLRNSFRMRQSPHIMTDDIGFRVLMEPKK